MRQSAFRSCSTSSVRGSFDHRGGSGRSVPQVLQSSPWSRVTCPEVDIIETAYAHLGRAAYRTDDNPYLRSVITERRSPNRERALRSAADGTMEPAAWLTSETAKKLLEAIAVGAAPRDLQLVLRDGQERVGVESVHAFLRAPIFWWLISHLWCLEVGRTLDQHMSARIMGYRLNEQFLAAPERSTQMFSQPRAAYARWQSLRPRCRKSM